MKDLWPLFAVITFGVLTFIAVLSLLFFGSNQSSDCEARGGVPYRSICLDPEALK